MHRERLLQMSGWGIVFFLILLIAAFLPVITPDPADNPTFRISVFEWLANKILFGHG